MNRVNAWSNGGGVQSTAIAALVCMGKLQRPDIAVIVDTERESSAVWEYLDKWTLPALNNSGVELVRIKKSEYATVDLYGGKSGNDILIPAFTDISGDIGKLPTYCSNEWKKRVLRRYLTKRYPGMKFTQWIGFTIDEMWRCFQETGKWEMRYPLIEQRMTRGDCVACVERIGWPQPPRSSCWHCPNRTQREWIEQKHNQPDDHKKAIQLEIAMRDKDDTLWLTQSGKPLSELSEDDEEEDFFKVRCDNGMCFV